MRSVGLKCPATRHELRPEVFRTVLTRPQVIGQIGPLDPNRDQVLGRCNPLDVGVVGILVLPREQVERLELFDREPRAHRVDRPSILEHVMQDSDHPRVLWNPLHHTERVADKDLAVLVGLTSMVVECDLDRILEKPGSFAFRHHAPDTE